MEEVCHRNGPFSTGFSTPDAKSSLGGKEFAFYGKDIFGSSDISR